MNDLIDVNEFTPEQQQRLDDDQERKASVQRRLKEQTDRRNRTRVKNRQKNKTSRESRRSSRC